MENAVNTSGLNNRSAWRRYGVALLAVALAVAGRAAVQYFGGTPYRFPILQLAVIVAAFYGSWGPGLLSVALVTVAWAYFLPPTGVFRLDQFADFMNLLSSAAINVLIVWGFSIARHRLLDGESQATTPPNTTGRPTATRGRSSNAAHPRLPMPKAGRSNRVSRLTLVGLVAAALLLAIFGSWGTLTTSGTTYFDDEAWLVPLFCLAMAPAIIIFGIGFLPVHSIDREATPSFGERAGH